jgi:hypothetical protein
VRLILLQQAPENFKEGKTKQRRNDQETKKQNKTRKQQQQCQSHTCSGKTFTLRRKNMFTKNQLQ